tara:strand:- start:588 stop:875 length:288 start_codon:yes stop_codon:yes gene_type:complete
MTQYDETNRGSCWPNKKKRPDKKDPDFTGSINVDGHDYWFDAWRKAEGAKENAPSLSFRVKRKDGKPKDEPKEAPRRASMKDALDDEIPFAAEFR